jgi:hypothetical protein
MELLAPDESMGIKRYSLVLKSPPNCQKMNVLFPRI